MRRDLFVLGVLILSVMLLIWNGSSFFGTIGRLSEGFGIDHKLSFTALTLNVALILFGWRYYVDLQQEMERRAESEARAAHIASTDGMTGLLNRKGFAEEGERMRTEAMADDRHVAIVSIQLARFKVINDRYGFDVGDEALRRIAQAIESVAGEQRKVARISGDEFVIMTVVKRGGREGPMALAEAALAAVTKPMMIEDKLLNVGAFVGIASACPGELKGRDILRRADIALAHARTGRIARPMWFDEGMERELLRHSEIEQSIRGGIDQDQFIPFFEPQMDLETNRVKGFEVLARWDHPLSGIVTPDRFISVAEENGLIGALSESVIRKAFEAAVQWDQPVDLSVNIAPIQLGDAWLAQKLVRLLTETGFPPERLTVEITESSLFSDLDMAKTIVESLKNQGIKLALDDFGTGFSSLSHLRALPFDSIKIDRAFVSAIHHDVEAEAIVRAVTTLAEAIDIPVTVEGIESEETHAAVLRYGCAVGQGWYFGKPMTADQAEQLLRHGTADLVAGTEDKVAKSA
ncbi:putative bifunctional diguanylate cyclase/phosphodiesterase [Sphingomicrobium marinum]|uniref:putative bifunctional diguanylate cyclase/phosphodiesterase n=1 Tax=Sphingomicrobium marinum TaxID=1227950 RepID=UPI00223F6F9D|nr:GGDEF domain-containing phosphodiesterase [Sphingomicrobium marinum]